MIEKLRKDDFIYCIWDGGPSTIIWLVERGEQLFLFSIINGVKFIFDHFAKRDNLQVDDIRRPFLLLGFKEYPVYANERHLSDTLRKYLKGEISAYEQRIGDAKKEQEKAVKESAKMKSETPIYVEDTGSNKPELKIVDSKGNK